MVRKALCNYSVAQQASVANLRDDVDVMLAISGKQGGTVQNLIEGVPEICCYTFVVIVSTSIGKFVINSRKNL